MLNKSQNKIKNFKYKDIWRQFNYQLLYSKINIRPVLIRSHD